MKKRTIVVGEGSSYTCPVPRLSPIQAINGCTMVNTTKRDEAYWFTEPRGQTLYVMVYGDDILETVLFSAEESELVLGFQLATNRMMRVDLTTPEGGKIYIQEVKRKRFARKCLALKELVDFEESNMSIETIKQIVRTVDSAV